MGHLATFSVLECLGNTGHLSVLGCLLDSWTPFSAPEGLGDTWHLLNALECLGDTGHLGAIECLLDTCHLLSALECLRDGGHLSALECLLDS